MRVLLSFIFALVCAIQINAQIPQIINVEYDDEVTLGELYLPLFVETLSADPLTPIASIEYQLFPDPGVGIVTFDSFNPAIDASVSVSIPIAPFTSAQGVQITLVAFDAAGNTSLPFIIDFNILDAPERPVLAQLEYFFDLDPGFGNGFPIDIDPDILDVDLTLQIPTTQLAPGSHDLYIRTQDANGNWSTTSYGEFIQADMMFDPSCIDQNDNGVIDTADFLTFLNNIGNTVNGGCSDGDYDNDNQVGVSDLLIILNYFGM
ncbi:MAG: hypothetical protein MK081_03205 [Flavobacteriales bacterium]|nr:hypothetical protein [Flavobacteriales bacterium]